MADRIAEWNQDWEKIEAGIRFTLGVEPAEIDDRHVVMRMPSKPDMSQATGLFSAGALVQLADIAATWLSLVHLQRGARRGGIVSVRCAAERRPRGEHRPRRRLGSRPDLFGSTHRDRDPDRGDGRQRPLAASPDRHAHCTDPALVAAIAARVGNGRPMAATPAASES